MQNKRKQVARVLQPGAKQDMTNMSLIQKMFFIGSRIVNLLWSGISGGSRAIGGYVRHAQRRDYIPLSPVSKINR